jgi:TPP-dependent indolepyruvate ferredoxin oxidoreductase alpha subunit
MKAAALLIGLSFVSLQAFAGKPCDELKSEIAAKLDAKGVIGYTLEAVANEETGDKTVVGSCEGGTKKITYVRGGGSAAAPAAEPASAAPAAE